MELTGGAALFRNHYFTISWNTFSIGDVSMRFYKYRELPSARILQRLDSGFITAHSLCQSLRISPQALGAFIRLFEFYSQLMLIDHTLPKIGYVYLIIFENTFKIGKTENFDRRYNLETRKKVIELVPVSNHNEVESELIRTYKASGYELDHGNEYFKLDNVHHVQTIFKQVLKGKEILPYNWRDSRLIQAYTIKTSNIKLAIHPIVGEIIVNKFSSDEDQRRKMIHFLSLINKQISNGYFDQIYDNQNQSVCSYWQYFNYVAIRRWKDDKVNVSRLFNSIKKIAGKTTYRTVREVVNVLVENKKIKEAFQKRYPDKTMMEYCENKEQPYLSGYYLDVVLVPTFVSKASTDALLDVNHLLIYLGSEVFAGSSIDEAKTNIQLQKFLSERKLIHNEISYGLNEDS